MLLSWAWAAGLQGPILPPGPLWRVTPHLGKDGPSGKWALEEAQLAKLCTLAAKQSGCVRPRVSTASGRSTVRSHGEPPKQLHLCARHGLPRARMASGHRLLRAQMVSVH